MFSLYVKLVGRMYFKEKNINKNNPLLKKQRKKKYSKEALGKAKKGNQFLN